MEDFTTGRTEAPGGRGAAAEARRRHKHRFSNITRRFALVPDPLAPDCVNVAALDSHRVTERFRTVLLMLTLYVPKLHGIGKPSIDQPL